MILLVSKHVVISIQYQSFNERKKNRDTQMQTFDQYKINQNIMSMNLRLGIAEWLFRKAQAKKQKRVNIMKDDSDNIKKNPKTNILAKFVMFQTTLSNIEARGITIPANPNKK